MKYGISVLFILVVIVGVFYVSFRSKNNDFQTLLEYEAQNRAFAYLSVQGAVSTDNSDQKQFWEAYLALEEQNQRKYQGTLQKFGVSIEPNAFTHFRVGAGEIMFSIAPETSVKVMRDAAHRYLPKLEHLKSLASEDKEFFSYVVAQEQAQADALTLAAENKYQDGTITLRNFLKDHSSSQ